MDENSNRASVGFGKVIRCNVACVREGGRHHICPAMKAKSPLVSDGCCP